MIDISKWALNNKKLIYFIVVVLIIGGGISYYNMSKYEDPVIKVPKALVVALYPGASPSQVELEVTDPLEKSIRSMKDVHDIQSKSFNDVAFIEVGIATTVPENEIEQHWDILRRKVANIVPSLPSGVSTMVKDDFGDVYGMFYAISGEGFTDKELAEYAEFAKSEIQDINGISDIIIYGKHPEGIMVEIHQDKMANLGVHPLEIFSTINEQNQTIYAGYFESGDNRIKIEINDRYKSLEDIGNIIIQGHESDQLRLKDIATITKEYVEPTRNEMLYDGERAIGICISNTEGTDVTKLGKLVDNKIAELQEEIIPLGIEFNKVFFQPERVNESINTFFINLIESVLIVIATLILTMGLKGGIIMGVNLIVIILGSIFVLSLCDGSLQRVSLGSFILAMGMLVDNGIVILDGILVDLKRGKSRKEALTSIGKKTAMPLLGATLIAILAFYPIYLSPDMAGVYVRDLFIVLAISLLLSWVLALILVPIQADRMLKAKSSETNKDPYDSKAYKTLRNVLTWVLHHKSFTIGAAVLLILISLVCYKLLPQEFFPDMSYNQLFIEYKLPENTNSTRVKKDLESIEKYLFSRGDVKHVTTSIGGTPSRYNLVRSIANPSLSYGELIVDMESPKMVEKKINEIQEYLIDAYPDAYVRTKRYNLMYKKYPIEARFSGPDPAVLKQLTDQAMSIMENNPKTRLVTCDWSQAAPTMVVDYNQPLARNTGITRTDMGLSLLFATEGLPLSSFYNGSTKESIYLKGVNPDGNAITPLETASIFSVTPNIQGILNKETVMGLMYNTISTEEVIAEMLRTVPLSQSASDIRIEWRDPQIIRNNGERSMSALCDPEYKIGAEEARQSILKEIEDIPLPAGYKLEWDGEYKANAESTQYLFKYFPLSIVLMIGILLLLFKDYKKPIIILCCIPLILIGVVFGIMISGKSFGFVAIVGTLGLIGMLIKNGVVLMDEIQYQLQSGIEPMKALLDSSASRFRPVMMASMTTILGVVPLLSDALFGSLAVTIIGGLFVGTLITLLFVPVLYAVFFGIKTPKEITNENN